MTSCERTEALLSAYHDDDLDLAEATEVEHHLAGCAQCRRALDDVRRLVQSAATLERRDAPPQLLTRVLAASLNRPEPPRLRLWARRYLPLSLAAAAAAAVVISVVVVRSSTRARSSAGVTGAASSAARAGTGVATPRIGSAAAASYDGAKVLRAAAAADVKILAGARREFARAERHYVRAVRQLRRIIAEDLQRWPSERRRAYLRAVGPIDSTVANSHKLAQMAPSDPATQEMLFRAYRQQLRFLQDAILGGAR